MKQIDTGSAPGNRLLNTLVGYVAGARPHLFDAWCAGEIEMDFNFSFLSAKSELNRHDVPTVLANLDSGGFIRARFDFHPNYGARISMRLPASASMP